MKAKITKWYRQGLWTLDKVRDAVKKKKITSEEYEEITGEKYV